jgi:hypothetical protein
MARSTSINRYTTNLWIMGLPTTGEDPTTLFANKVGEKALSENMKEKFNTFRGK